MSHDNLEDLIALLSRLRLVDEADLVQSRREAPRSITPAEFLQFLERRQLLTGFQSERIRRGETDGLVLGDYKLLYRNASGSFARVFRACSISDGTMIGVKVLRDRWSADPDMVRLFHREGDIGKQLKHPNIVPVYGVSVQNGYHFITMEFVEGGNLRDFLKIRGKLDASEACRYALNMAEALEYALRMGITHRDMKMTNALMSSQGIAKLIDFGLAADDKLLNRLGTSDLQQAVEYTTLERGSGAPPNDPRSDLFFLGVIFYELLSGTPPYPRTRDREARKRFNRYADVRPLSAVDPSVPPRVAQIVDRLMRINPVERYSSATELIRDLRQVSNTPIYTGQAADENGADGCTVLCVENRAKQQDLLRQYLSKHGYRVVLLSDAERGLNRLRNQAPDCIVFMGDAIGDRVVNDFRQALTLGRDRFVSAVLVLGEDQAHLESSVQNDNPLGRVLTQPIKLRNLRDAIQAGLDVRARYLSRG